MGLQLKADMKILVVDDRVAMRLIVKKMLGQMGFNNVFEAENGSNALESIRNGKKEEKPFDFIICDWNMPVMTGLELLIVLRSIEDFKELPFLMVTAESEQGNVMSAVREGVSHYIIKPISANVLREKICKIFEK